MSRTRSSSFRWLAGAALIAALGLVAVESADARPSQGAETAAQFANPPKKFYLALGDSLAFGFQRGKFEAEVGTGTYDPATFNTGYADVFAQRLRQLRPGVEVVNLSCPGETSSSFIDGGCAFHAALPLHNDYPASQSQLAAALEFLDAHPGQVNPITVNIGGNDLDDLFFHVCDEDVACTQAHLPAMLAQLAGNLDQVLTALHEASPRSEIVVLTQYNPYVAILPPSIPAFAAMNQVLAAVTTAHGARVADGVSPFTPETICSLSFICTPPLFDVHPTDAGYSALGQAVWTASGFGRVAYRWPHRVGPLAA